MTGHIEPGTLLSPMTQITSGLVLLNSNAPLGHMDSKKHEHLKQMHVQLKEKKNPSPYILAATRASKLASISWFPNYS